MNGLFQQGGHFPLPQVNSVANKDLMHNLQLKLNRLHIPFFTHPGTTVVHQLLRHPTY